jgi:hypothetical protein
MIGLPDGTLELRGAARQQDQSATCRALVGSARELLSLHLHPDLPGSDGLLGRMVGRGFRGAVDELGHVGTLPAVLLSELPVAALLSGYASLYTGAFPSPIPDAVLAGFPVDICAGWAAPASFMVQIRHSKVMPTPHGPTAPDVDGAWHDMPTLDPGSMRRQRLLERTGMEVWAMFRDTYAGPDGRVTVLHEYVLTAVLAPAPVREVGGEWVQSCLALPRVLPWAECPQAAPSADRVVGRRVADLRSMVKEELVGTSTCTHLNDLLSSLSQVDQLVESPHPGRAR